MPAAARRSQLIKVAVDRFGAQGYHDTSMDQIAESAGVTKPVLYQHFHSKQDLYLELLDTVGSELLEEVRARAAAEQNPYLRVLAGFRAYFGFVCERTTAFQILFGGSARLNDEFADSIRRLEEGIASTIATFIDADIDDEYRDLLGYAIVGLGEVAARRWVALHDDPASTVAALGEDEAERLALRLADLVWAGLRSLPGAPASRQVTVR